MVADLVYFSFSQLYKHGVHLGLQSTLLHSSMLKYLLPQRYLNFSLFNLNFTYASLRLVSNFIIAMISTRKPSLVVNSVSFLDDFLVDFFSGLNQPVARGLWVSGRLTNFRFVRQSSVRRFYLHKIIIKAFARIEAMGLSNSLIRNIVNRTFNPIRYKQSVFRHVMNLTQMPRFCFINDSTINAVSVNECFILNIPSICSADSGSSNISSITYPIPGNSVSLASVLLYYSIHKYSVQRGIYKERYLFLLKSIKAKIKLGTFLKKSLTSNKTVGKSRLPFIKRNIYIDPTITLLSQFIANSNLSWFYNYFFSPNLSIFKKVSRRFLLITRAFNVYKQFLLSKVKLNSVFSLLHNRLHALLLRSVESKELKTYKLSTDLVNIGDLVIASIFRDLFTKLSFDQNIDSVYSSDLTFSKYSAVNFTKALVQFRSHLRSFKSSVFLFNKLIYYNILAGKETQLVFSNIDIFNNSFVTFYKKLFFFEKKTIKLKYFKNRFLSFDCVTPSSFINVLFLWLNLFTNFYNVASTPSIVFTNEVAKNNPESFTTTVNAKTKLISSYSLFYAPLSINYRQVKPFTLNFQWIRPNNFSKTSNSGVNLFKFAKSSSSNARRW